MKLSHYQKRVLFVLVMLAAVVALLATLDTFERTGVKNNHSSKMNKMHERPHHRR